LKLFISQPMKDKTDAEILAERKRMTECAESALGCEVEVLDTFFTDYTPEANYQGVAFLGRSIMALADADAAIFGEGWENYRGCRIEHQVCVDYGVPIINEMEERQWTF